MRSVKPKRPLHGQAKIDAAVAAARDPEIYLERLKGKTERQIARDMGLPQQTVHGAIERSIADQHESIERHRELMAGRVSRLHAALLPLADQGDTDAGRTLLLAEKRLAELLGLDAAKKHEVTGAGGTPLLTLEAARALMAEGKSRP